MLLEALSMPGILVLSLAAASVDLLLPSWTLYGVSCALNLMQKVSFLTAPRVVCSQQEAW